MTDYYCDCCSDCSGSLVDLDFDSEEVTVVAASWVVDNFGNIGAVVVASTVIGNFESIGGVVVVPPW